jgi:hypothetical protein
MLTHGIENVLPRLKRPPRPSTTAAGSKEAIAEIKAYIAIRDDLLAEAEGIRSLTKIDSVAVANDFVVICLKPARPPYQGQCLPEADAIRERKRCDAVRARIAELRAEVTAKKSERVSAGAL